MTNVKTWGTYCMIWSKGVLKRKGEGPKREFSFAHT